MLPFSFAHGIAGNDNYFSIRGVRDRGRWEKRKKEEEEEGHSQSVWPLPPSLCFFVLCSRAGERERTHENPTFPRGRDQKEEEELTQYRFDLS